MTTNQLTDPRLDLDRAVEQVLGLVRGVTPADLGLPTPCDEYDVRHLLGHLLGVLGRVAHVARGGLPFDVPSIVLDVEDDAWAARCDEAAAVLRAVWADDAVLDRVLHLPFGDVPGRGAALAYTEELSAHAWDLASALGRREVLDAGLGEVALAAATRFIPDVDRGRIPFGPVVAVPDGAGPYERLAGWLGRDPDWTPAS